MFGRIFGLCFVIYDAKNGKSKIKSSVVRIFKPFASQSIKEVKTFSLFLHPTIVRNLEKIIVIGPNVYVIVKMCWKQLRRGRGTCWGKVVPMKISTLVNQTETHLDQRLQGFDVRTFRLEQLHHYVSSRVLKKKRRFK